MTARQRVGTLWIWFVLATASVCWRGGWLVAAEIAEPVKQAAENPHYFQYGGKPIILLTSDHTYFAVTAADFDYIRFLDQLAQYGCNFTRIYPGVHPVNYKNQPLILPWVKQADGRFNLDQWNDAYFARLHDFMKQAQSRGIIVDLVLFNGFGVDAKKDYQWRWEWSPFNSANNLQEVGAKRDDVCTLEEPALVRRERAYVHKIVTELNCYNNLIYDIADEPDYFNAIDDAKVNPWVSAMLDEAIASEAALPKKHLMAETFHPSLEDHGKSWGADPRTSWISVEYTNGLNHFAQQYAHKKPFVLIETTSPVVNPLGFWKSGYGVDSARVHCWSFLLAGGAGFMEFNDDYDSQAPAGRETTEAILRQKKVLLDFLYGFQVTKMKPCRDFLGVDTKATRDKAAARPWATAIAEAGKQYAVYISHSYIDASPKDPGHYGCIPAAYLHEFTLQSVPAKSYLIEWVNPVDGAVISASHVNHAGGELSLRTPTYRIDAALRVKAIDTSGP